ncbi:hypothetical protein GCM10009860_22120 [Microbacterium mitrae]
MRAHRLDLGGVGVAVGHDDDLLDGFTARDGGDRVETDGMHDPRRVFTQAAGAFREAQKRNHDDPASCHATQFVIGVAEKGVMDRGIVAEP